MKSMTFLFFTMIALLALGCNAENPICTDNFCAIGEVFPRSELDETQPFSEVDIDDSVIFATLIGGGTPVEVVPVEPAQPIQPPVETTDAVTLADIVADASSGGTRYVGQTVTIVAPVRFKFETVVALLTRSEKVSFFVGSPDDASILNALEEGRTYQFTVGITRIRPPTENSPRYAVSSDAKGSPIEVAPLETTVDAVVSDVAKGGTRFLGKTIEVRARVSFSVDNFPALSLSTNNPMVDWGVVASTGNEEKDKITLNPYKQGSLHTFTVLIYEIKPPEGLENQYRIRSSFIAGK